MILTYGYWQRRFGGDKSVIGRTITVDSTPHNVIGVMPASFGFRNDPELILPQRFDRNKIFLGNFSYQGIARLKPGVTLAASQRRRRAHAGDLAERMAPAARIQPSPV